jgi:hypothetical protein
MSASLFVALDVDYVINGRSSGRTDAMQARWIGAR